MMGCRVRLGPMKLDIKEPVRGVGMANMGNGIRYSVPRISYLIRRRARNALHNVCLLPLSCCQLNPLIPFCDVGRNGETRPG